MRILTQDKDAIFNLDRFDLININDDFGFGNIRIVGSYGKGPYDFWRLGTYRTEENLYGYKKSI